MKTKWYETLSALCAAAVLLAGVCACKGTADTEYVYVTDTTPPAAVTNINAQAGDGQVVLTWSDPADTDLYGVRVSYTSTGGASGNIRAAFTSGILVAKGAQTYIVTGLTNGTPYTFSVYTVDKSQNESTAAAATATPVDSSDKTAPAEALSFVAKAGDACATLSWEEPADSDYYGVKISATPAAGTLASPVVLLKGTTSLSVTGLTNAQSYTFTAQTLDTSLNASAGTTATTTPASSADTTPPADVTKLTAANKDAAVLLTWTDATATDVYGYEVSWNGTGAINRAATSTAVASGSMIVAQGAGGCYISNLVNGTSYTFTVKSVDTNGNRSAGVTAEITPAIIEAGPLTISCKADVTAATSGNVTVTVAAATDSASALKTVAYRNGTVRTAAELFALGAYSDANTGGYTVVTPDTDGAYTFTVEANGTFTAAALDTAGREECAYITVSNIDKTAPGAVTNLAAGYSSAGSTLTVTWTKPGDSDLHHYSFLCTDTTNNGATVKSIDSVDATITKVTLTASADGITEDHSYSITVYAYDAVGNKSSETTTEITTSATAVISGITVTRTNFSGKTHLDTAMTDRSMTATITGSNLTLASGLYLKVKNVTAGTITTQVTTATSSSDTSYTFTFTADTAVATYNVIPYVSSGAVSGVAAEFTVTAPADVTGIALGTSQFAKGTSGRDVTATITGTDFDIRGTTTVKVIDATGMQAGSTITIDSTNGTETTFSADIPVPTAEGYYAVTVYFDGVADTTTATLWIYGSPAVTQVSVPLCGRGATVDTVPVTITGTSFSGVSGVTNTITVQREGGTSVTATIVSATTATARIDIPTASANTYKVTVYINSIVSTVTGTLTVKDYSGWAVGDIMGADGTTRLAVANATSQTAVTKAFTSTVPAAVICGFNSFGAAVGVGLKQGSLLRWAPDDTTGYNTNFTAIQAICTGSDGSYTFIGDTDGSDNWAAVCAADSTAADNAATNYPVFNYASTYASSAATNLIGTACADGWYVPSVSELCALYKCCSTVNTSIGYVSGGTPIGTGDMDAYWSSSQYSGIAGSAWNVVFNNGYTHYYYKYADWNRNVRVIRTF